MFTLFLRTFLFMDVRKRKLFRAEFIYVSVCLSNQAETLFKQILFKFNFLLCLFSISSVLLLHNEYTFLYSL